MLMNSLHAEVAEKPGGGPEGRSPSQAEQDWRSFSDIVGALRVLADEETLFIESGRVARVVRSDEAAPRVVVLQKCFLNDAPNMKSAASSGSMTPVMSSAVRAAGWTHTGPQDALPLAERVLATAADQHFAGSLAGKFVVSGGMGAAGGALPLAGTLHGAAFLGIEADGQRIKRRVRDGFCDICVNNLDEALRILKNAVRRREAVSVGLIGNCAEILPEFVRRGVLPDLLTDQTAVQEYIPAGWSLTEAVELRKADPNDYDRRAAESLARHVNALLGLRKLGAIVFEFGNGLRAAARKLGVEEAFSVPDFVEAYLGPMRGEGEGPLRWVALSGEVSDIRRTDNSLLELFGDNAALTEYVRQVSERVRVRGLPARSAWLGRQERARFAVGLNELVAKGELKGPVVIAGEAPAEPTEMASLREALQTSGSETRAEQAKVEALLRAASGASWISCGVGPESEGGVSCFSRAVVVDGSRGAAGRLERLFGPG